MIHLFGFREGLLLCIFEVCKCEETRYYVSDDNKECRVPIADSKECEKAAAVLGGEWDEDRDWDDRCPGCLFTLSDAHFNFNTQKKGKCKNKDQVPVCKAMQNPLALPLAKPHRKHSRGFCFCCFSFC